MTRDFQDPGSRAELEKLLMDDGKLWRESIPVNMQSVRDGFHRRRARVAVNAEAHHGISSVRKSTTRLHTIRRSLGLGVAVTLLIVVFVIGKNALTKSSHATGLGFPPLEFTQNPKAATGSTSPQEAFSKSVSLFPCRGNAARSLTTTWLAASHDFGVVYVLADCSNYAIDPRPVVALLPFGMVPSGEWMVLGGVIMTRYSVAGSQLPSSTANASQIVPSWLPLPPDAYLGGLATAGGQYFIANLADWVSQKNIFVTGTFNRPAIHAADAQSITINTYPGWISQQNGITIVVVQLSKASTFFFAGTAPPSQITEFATQAQLHLSTLFTYAG